MYTYICVCIRKYTTRQCLCVCVCVCFVAKSKHAHTYTSWHAHASLVCTRACTYVGARAYSSKAVLNLCRVVWYMKLLAGSVHVCACLYIHKVVEKCSLIVRVSYQSHNLTMSCLKLEEKNYPVFGLLSLALLCNGWSKRLLKQITRF